MPDLGKRPPASPASSFLLGKYASLEHLRTSAAGGSADGSLPGAYGRLYLQKIVQIQFNLPPSPAGSMPGLLTETVGDSIKPSTSETPLGNESGFLRELKRELKQAFIELIRKYIRLIRYYAPWLVLFGAAGVMFYLWNRARLLGASDIPPWFKWFAPIPYVAGFIVGVSGLVADYRSYRTKQAQHQIDRSIRQIVNAGAATVEDVMRALLATGLEPRRQKLARQRAQRLLADESPRRTQAESEIKEHLPTLPRSAKRLFNHLRVLLVIAEQKQMFGGQPELQARHLGKWAVLLERWPELGSALTAQPERLAELEAATSLNDLSTRLGPAVPASVASQGLLTFLKSPTKLAPVVQRLVYFQPALQEPVSTGSGPTTVAPTL